MSRLGLFATGAGRGVVRFSATAEEAARVVLQSRTLPRLLLDLGADCPPEAEALRERAASLPWEDWLPRDTPWAVHAVGRSPALRNTLFAAQVAKDGIRDRFSRLQRSCPPVDPQRPALWVDLQVESRRAILGLDLGGGALHRRGRVQEGKAPLREDVAAGLAWLAGPSPGQPLLDPFCGSGTLIVEAASVLLGIPAGRDPAATALPLLAPFAGLPLAELARSGPRPEDLGAPILAADRDPAAVRTTRENLSRAGLAGRVRTVVCELAALRPRFLDQPGLVLANPPWGLRLGRAGAPPEEEAAGAWEALGAFVHRLPAGWRLAVLSGTPAHSRRLGLKAERKWPVAAGGVEARWLVYTLGRP